jgi:hypothetical protein
MAESKSEGADWEDEFSSELVDNSMLTLLTLLALLALLVLDPEVLEALDKGGMKGSADMSWRNLKSQAHLKEWSASSS